MWEHTASLALRVSVGIRTCISDCVGREGNIGWNGGVGRHATSSTIGSIVDASAPIGRREGCVCVQCSTSVQILVLRVLLVVVVAVVVVAVVVAVSYKDKVGLKVVAAELNTLAEGLSVGVGVGVDVLTAIHSR